MAVVDIKGIKKQFGEVKAVDGVDLAIREGELLVILGPSGCGKTTLLRMIAGLETPTGGDILIDDRVVTSLPPRDREIAMVFQSYALYPHMTVFDNIAFPLRSQRDNTKEQITSSVEEACATLGISHLLDRMPRQLSGGERQRVALARALVKEPKVLLLDEPLSNLDAKLRALARDELTRFQRRTGITTIFVTHDQIEAMGMGDRIVVMSKGTVRQVGTPEEVYHDSADTFVATFIGSPGINLLDRQDCLLGFRPEQFQPVELLGNQDDLVEFSFLVQRVEYLGADQLIYGQIEDSRVNGVTPVIAKLASEVHVSFPLGESHAFGIPAERLRFYDKESGLRTDPRPM